MIVGPGSRRRDAVAGIECVVAFRVTGEDDDLAVRGPSRHLLDDPTSTALVGVHQRVVQDERHSVTGVDEIGHCQSHDEPQLFPSP